ncbi:MAG TPA: HAMP domain-containing sensor histidine kinase [Terriglobales bacterium]|nr:HAMP domain-containing sensor histidine kinase [Terriglobales bacterium]
MVPSPTPAEIEHGVPLFLEQLVTALRLGMSSSSEIDETAILHGHDLLAQGFSVSQVVHDYGDVCQTVTELVVERNAPVGADEFRMLNGCLDVAIAGAVTEYSRAGRQNLATAEAATAHEGERFALLSHELRDLNRAALVAFAAVKSGNVGVGGSTGRIVYRALLRSRDLIARALAEATLAQHSQKSEPLLVDDLIEELVEIGLLEANARGIGLKVVRAAGEAVIDADREVLVAAVMVLLQNALRFTKPKSAITFRSRTMDGRVLVEIQDACGGMPAESIKKLSHAAEQTGADRPNLGHGLTFTRKAVEAFGGRVFARNVARVGCMVTVDLPISTSRLPF